MGNKPVAILISATTPWPLSARLAMRMIAHGCVVSALCPRGHVLNEVSGIGRVQSYSGPASMAALERTLRQSRPDIVVPCDDRAVWQLHELHELRPEFRPLIEASLGAPAFFGTVSNRARLMDTARRIGLRVPESRAVDSKEDIAGWFREHPHPAVVKLDGTWGGSGVAVVESAGQAMSAWQRFNAPQPLASAVKRWLVNGDPLAFWSKARSTSRTVSIQSFIPGRSANAMAACWQGRVLGTVTVEVLCTQGPTGASTIVRLVQNEEILKAVEALVQALGLSGFCGMDFILEESTGAAHLIELNARCTQLGHLVLPSQGDLAGLLCAKLGAGGTLPASAPIDRDIIAFFPQALAWNPDSPYIHQCHHDVPWSEPTLVRELLREPWAERQRLYRVYHRLMGKRPQPLPNHGSFLRLAAQYGFSSDPAEGAVKLRELNGV